MKSYFIHIVAGEADVRKALRKAASECGEKPPDITVFDTLADLARECRDSKLEGCPLCGGGIAQLDVIESLAIIVSIAGESVEWEGRSEILYNTCEPRDDPPLILCRDCGAGFHLTSLGLLSVKDESDEQCNKA